MKNISKQTDIVGAYMAKHRYERGWTKHMVRKKTGLSRSTILNIENGRGGINLDTISAMLNAYDSTWTDLAKHLDSCDGRG